MHRIVFAVLPDSCGVHPDSFAAVAVNDDDSIEVRTAVAVTLAFHIFLFP